MRFLLCRGRACFRWLGWERNVDELVEKIEFIMFRFLTSSIGLHVLKAW